MNLSRVARTVGLVAWMLAGCASSSPHQQPPPDTAPPSDAALVDAIDGPVAMIDAPPAGMTGERLRLVAGNLTSGTQQAYEAPGTRILRGLVADVAMLQEFNAGNNTPADLRAFVDQAFGTSYSFFRGTGQIPNGVVSRYPILASGEWADSDSPNREFTWTQIDIPGPIDLFAISVHLLTASATVRNSEAGQLVPNIQALPAGAYVVLGGDFNTDSRTEPCITTLSAVLATAAPYPADQASVENTNANRNKPYDWVLVSSALDALETDVTIGRNRFPSGFVVDTRVYSPISDLAPAMISDSGATNMQHMAVVRDFLLPAASTPSVQVVAPNGGESWTAGTSQTVRWTASGVADVVVEIATDGATFTALAGPIAASAGQVSVTAPSTASTTARIRVAASPGGAPSDTSDAAFTITTTPPPVGRVFINEVLANEPGSDITAEFVELVNSGGSAVDVSGWTIADAVMVRHTFPQGTTIAAGKALVVLGSTASTGELNLSNGGDTVTLANASGAVDSVTYTSVLSGSDGVSMNRMPDASPTGTFVLHTALSSTPRSPGTRVDGMPF